MAALLCWWFAPGAVVTGSGCLAVCQEKLEGLVPASPCVRVLDPAPLDCPWRLVHGPLREGGIPREENCYGPGVGCGLRAASGMWLHVRTN
jgi:hypothetical protein